MIYFLDNDLQLQKIVTSKNIYETNHEHELNGYIIADALLPLDYVKKFIDKVEYFGYYYRGTFYLHKIQSTEDLHQDDVCLISGRHIFFDDMLYGKLIEDVRPQNRNALDILNSTITANSRWRPQLVDTTGTLSTNFYWQPMFDVIEFVNKEFRLDFLPKVLFDGQKINGFDIEFAEKIGNDTAIRIPFGYRTLELTHEIDYSEIVTKLVVHGKGEEVGDGYGRRINIADVEFSRNGVKSPKGSLYLEDESLTAIYGNDGQRPREGREVFEDIESPSELAEAGYNLYQEVSRPRMAFEAKVADIGDVGIGDSVMIIRREHDLYFKARIHKVKVDLLNPDDAEVELGDYEFFKETKAERRSRKDDEAYKRRSTSMIEQLKRQFDKDFNDRVNQFREEFNQAKIDIFAEIEADRARMEAEFNQTIDTWTDVFNKDVENAMKYAEEQAKVHSDAVEGKLDEVTGNHAGMLDELKADVMDIDDFLGDSRALTLDERFQNITQNFEERIRNIDSTHYNIIRGTSFDNPDLFAVHSQVQVITNEVDNFVRMGTGTTNLPYVMNMEYFNVVKGKTYYLVFMYRTTEVPEIDFIEIRPPSEYGTGQKIDLTMTAEEKATVMTGYWTKKVVTIVPDRTMPVRLLLGTNFGAGNTQKGVIDFKKLYLTTTNNREWLPHPDDDTQNVSEIVRRVTLLEDGQSELITRSEYDFETGQLDQYIKSVEDTVEGNKTVLQRVEDWQATNGASIEETIYGFNQKVWLNDISNIGANLIPQSSNAWEDGGLWIANGAEAALLQNLRTKEHLPIRPSTTYTLSSNSMYNSNIERVDIHQYLYTGGWINRYTIPSNGEVTFTTWGTASHVRITLIAREGFSIPTSFIDHPDGRIKIKLEVGNKSTPMLNAISRIEQLADRVSLQVQQLDGEFLTESDIQIRSNYVQLGSKQLGDEQFASIFRVSPKSIDAITDNLNLTGNLNVKGQITSLAVDAIEGRFSDLFTSHLTANIITADHLSVGTAMIDKLFATSGRIDQLITKDHFVRNIKALSIDAVEGNFSSLITKYFSANYIDVDWISGKNAWFESMYTSNAMIRRLTAQHAFIRDVQAIEITANQLNIQTLHSKLRGVEGGLTIYGPDGRVLINNSVLRASFDVQIRPNHASSSVSFTGLNYQTTSSYWQTFEHFYTDFKGSQLLVSWAVSFDGNATSEMVNCRVRGFGGSNPIGTNQINLLSDGSTRYYNQIIDLGVPNYNTVQAYLEFRRDPNGSSSSNSVSVRVLRVSMIN